MIGQLILRIRPIIVAALTTSLVAFLSGCQRVQSPALDTVELSIIQPDRFQKAKECKTLHSAECRYSFEIALSAPLAADLDVYFETRQQKPTDIFFDPNIPAASIEAEQRPDLVKTSPNSRVRIEHGKKKGIVTIETLPDELAEPDERFVVGLKVNVADFDRIHFGNVAAYGTIEDDNDIAPVIQFAQVGNVLVPDNVGVHNLKLLLVDPADSDLVSDKVDKTTMMTTGYNVLLPVRLTVYDSNNVEVKNPPVKTLSLVPIQAHALDPDSYQAPTPEEPVDIHGDPLVSTKRAWINLPINFQDLNYPTQGDLTVKVSLVWNESQIKGVKKPPNLSKLNTEFTLVRSEGTQKINHTGVTKCLTTNGWYTLSDYCTAPEKANYPGQDADIARTTSLDASNFQLISIDRTVSVIDPNTKIASTITVADQCVRDQTTGLLWEVKLDSPIKELKYRNRFTLYDWYEPEPLINGGDKRDRSQLTPASDCGLWNGAYCTTYDYIARLNKTNFCGHSDWRLPKLDELLSIVDFGNQTLANAQIKKPLIPNIFGPTAYGYYWTAITSADNSETAWVVSFGDQQTYDIIDDGRTWRSDKTIAETSNNGHPVYTRLVTK